MAGQIKLIVSGVGRVGRLVRELAQADPAIELVAVVARGDAPNVKEADLKGADALVDFTHGDNVLDVVAAVAAAGGGVRVVTGTSGWGDDEARVRELVRAHRLYFLYGANFALGTALFTRVVGGAATMFNAVGDFDAAVFEVHHRHKRDMPSGTAKKLAAAILARFDAKKRVLYGTSPAAVAPDQLHIACLRLGENKGYHEVRFDSPDEVVTISQQTRDRGAYARGALAAVKWLMRQDEPGYYTFDDVVEDILHG